LKINNSIGIVAAAHDPQMPVTAQNIILYNVIFPNCEYVIINPPINATIDPIIQKSKKAVFIHSSFLLYLDNVVLSIRLQDKA
jgi:hypothetical protein